MNQAGVRAGNSAASRSFATELTCFGPIRTVFRPAIEENLGTGRKTPVLERVNPWFATDSAGFDPIPTSKQPETHPDSPLGGTLWTTRISPLPRPATA
jgi:hypothetical protein